MAAEALEACYTLIASQESAALQILLEQCLPPDVTAVRHTFLSLCTLLSISPHPASPVTLLSALHYVHWLESGCT